METNIITGMIVDTAVKIHSTIGTGCFERVYEEILYFEFNKKGLNIERQITMPIEYDILYIPDAYRIDLLYFARGKLVNYLCAQLI